MRELTVLLGLSLLLVSGCGRAPTKAAPEPDRNKALVRAEEQPPPKRGDTQGIPRSAAERAAWRKAQQNNIREAVFRYQFHSDGGGPQSKPNVFFISVEGKDPSDEFLKRFSGNKPPVRKRSRSRISRKRAGFSWMWVEDSQTGEPGLIYSVDSIKWSSDSAVLVEGGYYAGGRAAAGYEYRVACADGHWVVKRATGKWVS